MLGDNILDSAGREATAIVTRFTMEVVKITHCVTPAKYLLLG